MKTYGDLKLSEIRKLLKKAESRNKSLASILKSPEQERRVVSDLIDCIKDFKNKSKTKKSKPTKKVKATFPTFG